ncbi:MAG: HTH domain-containing protein, partial [Bacteroidales bacterium]
MKIIDRIEHIRQIDQLIRLKCTGNLQQLSEKTQLSERQVRRYIEEMRDMGADIYFDRYLST